MQLYHYEHMFAIDDLVRQQVLLSVRIDAKNPEGAPLRDLNIFTKISTVIIAQPNCEKALLRHSLTISPAAIIVTNSV